MIQSTPIGVTRLLSPSVCGVHTRGGWRIVKRRPSVERRSRSHQSLRPCAIDASGDSVEDIQLIKSGDSKTGEDAAKFELGQQSLLSWGIFSGLLAGALGVLYVVQPSLCCVLLGSNGASVFSCG